MYISSCIMVALALVSGIAQAQKLQSLDVLAEHSADYVISRWGMEHGLPSDRVRAVIQTRNGYVWAATFNGLARFDGVRFTVFNDATTPALKNRLINRLHEDPQGRLWIGGDTGNLAWLDETGFHGVLTTNAWHISPITRIVDRVDGTVLVLNRDGQLLLVTNGIGVFPNLERQSFLYSDIFLESPNRIWLIRRGGAMRQFNGSGEVADSAGPDPAPGYRNAAPSQRGGFWIREGLRLRRWHDGAYVEDLGMHGWGDRRSVVIQEISTGEVLVGTVDQGLFVIGEDGHEKRLTRANGLTHNWVESIFEDREKSIWIGANGGGLQLLRQRVLSMVTPTDRWQNQPVQSVTPAADGGVWIGTLGAGVYRYDGNRFWHIIDDLDQGGSYVRSVFEDRNRRLWVGTEGRSLYWWKGGEFGGPPADQAFPNLIYGVNETKDGAVWVGTQNGCIRFQDGEASQRLGTELAQADVRSVVQAKDGAVWLGMRGGGVARYNDGKFTQFMRPQGLPYEYVWCTCADPDGSVWIGTSGGGVARYRDGKFFQFTMHHGLPSDFICHIETDEHGYLWVASYAGIFRVKKEELDRCALGTSPTVNCLVLDSSEGLTSLEMSGGNQPAGCRTADGRFWFASSRGLAVVDPARINVVRVPPPVAIEEVLVDGQPAAIKSTGRSGGKEPEREVVVPPGSGQIEFKYAALSFGAPQRVRFKYQMSGLEASLVDAGNRRSAFYTHLAPGTYRFRVIACNHFGYWNEDGAELRLRILPHLWQTWWFLPLCWVAGATVLGTLMIGTLRRRHHRRMEVLERARLVERERVRIARDLHDDLGTGLTEIDTTSALGLDPTVPPHEAREYFGEISQRARGMVIALDEIVWAVNPKNDTVVSLVVYFCHFTEQFLRPTGINCRFDVEDELPELPLDSDKRHSLFLALKEALNNAVRHAQATNVQLAIKMVGEVMRISVTDDGCGFGPRADHSGADGLVNLRLRLEQMGGSCEITSAPGNGTQVVFVVPLRPQNVSRS